MWYGTTWQESAVAGLRAAIFIGSNQLKTADGNANASVTQAAATGNTGGSTLNQRRPRHVSGESAVRLGGESRVFG